MFSGRLSSAPTQNDINCVSPNIFELQGAFAVVSELGVPIRKPIRREVIEYACTLFAFSGCKEVGG